MRSAVIVSAARTPIGRFGGALKDVPASTLAGHAIRAALERSGVEPGSVDDVYLGNALQAAEDGYAARRGALEAGIPDQVPAICINRQCSSGAEAINLAAHSIMTGEADVLVAGGTENMSQVPFMLRNGRWSGLGMGHAQLIDGLLTGLDCPMNHYHMGVTAENVAQRYEVSRREQDELALSSHQRAVLAMEEGRFEEQIVPVEVPQRKGDPVRVTTDEGPRADTTLERLARLQPVFRQEGTVTAGNASSINDAAAAVVMMSEERAREMDLRPRLRWRGRAVAGVEPAIMGTGPIPAVRRLLRKTGFGVSDIDLVELNEAFAAQALYCIRELGLDHDKTNVSGSGISLGHPLGATGALMTVRMLHDLERTGGRLGLVTMCVGGGQGCATLFERAE